MIQTHDEMIAVIQAHKEGKQIECKKGGDDTDSWDAAFPSFNFADFEYRVKPEPTKPREWWFLKNIGNDELRYGWSRHEERQVGVDYLEQVHVREVIDGDSVPYDSGLV